MSCQLTDKTLLEKAEEVFGDSGCGTKSLIDALNLVGALLVEIKILLEGGGGGPGSDPRINDVTNDEALFNCPDSSVRRVPLSD